MRLTRVEINDYKSIEKLEFKIQKYGSSYTTFLLGKNETGKSNVLNALSLLNKSGEKVNFLDVVNQNTQAEYVSVVYDFEVSRDKYITILKEYEKIDFCDEFLKKIKIKKLQKEIYVVDDGNEFYTKWRIELDEFDTNEYIQKKNVKQVNDGDVIKNQETFIVCRKEDVADEDMDGFVEINWKDISKIIVSIFEKKMENYSNNVTFWQSSSNHLITDKIDLMTFSQKPSEFLPLKNMFQLCGYSSVNEIVSQVNKIDRDIYRRKLMKNLSDKTTEYLNKKWPDHDITIDVEITSQKEIVVNVQDKDNVDGFYKMSDRSQGFQQFVSLLLSISITSGTDELKDHLILIDEPENHMHPSGVQWMRDELLEIGKNNYLFVSTHSNFMVDRKNPERHFLLTKSKKKSNTECKQLSSTENINDDVVLKEAFGINVIKDFISDKKVLVEGLSDKVLLKEALNKVNCNHGILITNGRGANIDSVASSLMYHDIYPMVVVDDDDDGKKYKDKILKLDNGYTANTVFTIRDLNGSIVEGGTIEDTLPKDYIQSKVKEVFDKYDEIVVEITLVDSVSFINQIKEHLQINIDEENKKKKKEIINKILQDVKITVAKQYSFSNFKQKAPLLYGLAEKIIEKFANL